MGTINVRHVPRPRTLLHRNRGAVIRVGTPTAHEGGGTAVSFWLTVAEAEVLRAELDAAILKAKAASHGAPPEPPSASSAALPAAA